MFKKAMKSKINKVLALVLAVVMTASLGGLVSSAISQEIDELIEGTISVETLAEIDDINAEIAELRMNLNSLDSTESEEKTRLENLISQKRQQMFNLGAEEVQEDFLLELFESSAGTSIANSIGITATAAWHPSDIIKTFVSGYDITGVSVTYSGKTQYHITFMSVGSDRYLHKNTTKNVYNSFSAGSSEAANFIADLIRIYGDKLIGSLNPVLNWLPYELITSSKPTVNQISSTGNAILANLNTVSMHKFVYVYDSAKDEWLHCLTTNRVSVGHSVIYALNLNGYAYNSSKTFLTSYMVDGDWSYAYMDANTGFTYKYTMNTNITKIALRSNSKNQDVIIHNIHNPSVPANMI